MGEGDGVELARLRVVPRRGAADLGGELVEQVGDPGGLGRGLVGDGEVGAGEADDLAEGRAVEPVALAVAAEGRQTELVEQSEQLGLVGGDPLPAELEERPRPDYDDVVREWPGEPSSLNDLPR